MQLASWLRATVPLWAALLLAVGLSAARPLTAAPAARRRLQAAAAACLILQLLHFAEELWTGFHTAYPRLLRLMEWETSTFLAFNAFWIAVWTGAIASAGRSVRALEWALWFLGIATLLNGIAHPLLALLTRGYFPGLLTAPFVGVAGLLLLLRLLVATRPKPVVTVPTPEREA